MEHEILSGSGTAMNQVNTFERLEVLMCMLCYYSRTQLHKLLHKLEFNIEVLKGNNPLHTKLIKKVKPTLTFLRQMHFNQLI